MSLISNESMTIKDKTYRLTLRIVETILKVLKRKGIQNYNSYLSDQMGTPRPNISRMLNCDGNITIKTLLKLLDAAELEMEIKFYDRETYKPIEQVSVSTVKLPEDLKQIQVSFNPEWQIELMRDLLLKKTQNLTLNLPSQIYFQEIFYQNIQPASRGKFVIKTGAGEKS